MVRPLAPGFKLSEGALSDWDELWKVWEEAFGKDEIWQVIFKNCKKEELHFWVMNVFACRWKLPDITFYKIIEESTGRIAGWTALQFPWADRPLNEKELAISSSHDMSLSTMIEGMKMEALPTFFESDALASKHGYEPQTEYHRRGTMIRPDFQERGFGTFLTQHCNSIADKRGSKTWVTARFSSAGMFRHCGFKDLAVHSANLERWGGNTEKATTWLLVRDALN